MIVELKEKLVPNTFLFWDGKKLVSVSKDDLLGEIAKRLSDIEDFQESLLKRQAIHEERMKSKFKKFISIFKRGDK